MFWFRYAKVAGVVVIWPQRSCFRSINGDGNHLHLANTFLVASSTIMRDMAFHFRDLLYVKIISLFCCDEIFFIWKVLRALISIVFFKVRTSLFENYQEKENQLLTQDTVICGLMNTHVYPIVLVIILFCIYVYKSGFRVDWSSYWKLLGGVAKTQYTRTTPKIKQEQARTTSNNSTKVAFVVVLLLCCACAVRVLSYWATYSQREVYTSLC